MLILNEEQADILQEDSSDLKKLQRKFLLFSTMQYFNGGQNQSQDQDFLIPHRVSHLVI